MTFEYPSGAMIPGLRALWKEAFGDSDAFLDDFFRAAFSPDRCRCVTEEGRIAAALYWFDCELEGEPLAYLYAVATARAFRGRGLCHALMADAHALLEKRGFRGTVLVPGEASLAALYGSMGYRWATRIRELACAAAGEPVALRSVDAAEYARLRRELLPEGAALQEGPALDFLGTQARFYAGDRLLLAARREGDTLFAPELLGGAAQAPRVLRALDCAEGRFRMPGEDREFAMFRHLNGGKMPKYLGFAFD